jgi:hypothetical protein
MGDTQFCYLAYTICNKFRTADGEETTDCAGVTLIRVFPTIRGSSFARLLLRDAELGILGLDNAKICAILMQDK